MTARTPVRPWFGLGAAALLASAVLSSCPGAALGQTDPDPAFPPAFPTFPQTTSFAALKLWVAGNTSLAQDRVVLTSAQAVFAFEDAATAPQADGLLHRRVREEVINQDLALQLGGRSATAGLAFDCAHAQTTVDSVALYPGNNLIGGPMKTVAAAHWMAANTDLDLTDLAQAACGKSLWHAPDAAVGAATSPRTSSRGQAKPSPIEAGASHWVQIGAFATAAEAQARWRTLQARWPAQTEGRSLRTEAASHGKTPLRRALAGPFGAPQARAFCAKLKTAGGDCLVR